MQLKYIVVVVIILLILYVLIIKENYSDEYSTINLSGLSRGELQEYNPTCDLRIMMNDYDFVQCLLKRSGADERVIIKNLPISSPGV